MAVVRGTAAEEKDIKTWIVEYRQALKLIVCVLEYVGAPILFHILAPLLPFICWRPYSLSYVGAFTLFHASAMITAPFMYEAVYHRPSRHWDLLPFNIITNQP